MLTITCTTPELARRAKEITDDLERHGFVDLADVETEIVLGDHNSIDGESHLGYDVAALHNIIFLEAE